MEIELNGESAKSPVRLPVMSKSLWANRPRFGASSEALETAADELIFDPAARDRLVKDPASSFGTMLGDSAAADDDLVLFNRMGVQEASAVSCSPPAAVCYVYIAVVAFSYAAIGWWAAVGVGAAVKVAFYGSALEPDARDVGQSYISPV